MKSKWGVFSEIDFPGASFDENGAFCIFKQLKKLPDYRIVWFYKNEN